MEISQILLGMMFVYGVTGGILSGVVYDGLRIIRMLFGDLPAPRPRHRVKKACEPPDLTGTVIAPDTLTPPSPHRGRAILLFAEDVLFGLFSGIVLLLLLYYANDGQFRFLAVIGLGCGFFVYYHTLGRLVTFCSPAIIGFLRRLIVATARGIAYPFRLIWRCMGTGFRFVRTRMARRLHRRRFERMDRATGYLLDQKQTEAAHGFGLDITSLPDTPADPASDSHTKSAS